MAGRRPSRHIRRELRRASRPPSTMTRRAEVGFYVTLAVVVVVAVVVVLFAVGVILCLPVVLYPLRSCLDSRRDHVM